MSYLFRYYYNKYDRFMKIFKLDKNKEIINVIVNPSNLSILDIGGGTGTLAVELIKLGAEVTIIDPEVKMTEVAKAKNKNIKVINSYSHEIPLEDKSVDIIVIRDAFHHIVEKEKTLKECSRLLKNNGQILIYEFEKNHIITKMIFIFERCCFEKVKMLTKNEMEKLTNPYFKKINMFLVSAHEYIYLGSVR